MTVCHDGTVYFVSALGRLVWIDAEGGIRVDTQRPDLVDMRAVACDERNYLYAAVASIPPRMVVLGPTGAIGGGPAFEVVSACELKQVPSAIAVHGGTVFLLALSPEAGGTRGFLQRLTDGCRRDMTFGLAPVLPYASLVARAVSRGVLFWSLKKDGLVFMPSFPYEAHVYERDGTRRRLLDRGDPGFLRPGLGPGLPVLGDEVLRAAELPSGEIVVFIGKQRENWSDTYLELLDEDLRPRARFTANADGVLGVLHGASGDGAVYFGKGTRSGGVFITRARLVSGK
jgi:hypothetical protein